MRITVWPLLRILSIAHLRADWLPLSLSIATATKGLTPPSFLSEVPLPTHISLVYYSLTLSFLRGKQAQPRSHQLSKSSTTLKKSHLFTPSNLIKIPMPCFFSHFLDLPKRQMKPPTHTFLFYFPFFLQFSVFLSNKEERINPKAYPSPPKLARFIPFKVENTRLSLPPSIVGELPSVSVFLTASRHVDNTEF